MMRLLLLLAISQVALATKGVDVSTWVSEANWGCLKNNGYNFGVVRASESNGHVDPNGVHTVANAWAAGIAHVDIYIFPCPSCGNPEGQIEAMVKNMGSIKFGMVWLDIEGTQYWGTQSNNRAFFEGLISGCKKMGVSIGVYTSRSQWEPIMGSYSGGSAYPLWYAHYDGNPSFSDFEAFGGWSKPNIKQYKGTTGVCNVGIDEDWYP